MDKEINLEPMHREMRRMARLSHVPRWSVIPCIRQQNVAEHCYNVAWIAQWLCANLQLEFTSNDMCIVFDRALHHDADEALSGDKPTTFKHKHSDAPYEFEDVYAAVVKLADVLEAIMFAKHERLMGNSLFDPVWDDLTQRYGQIWAGVQRWIDPFVLVKLPPEGPLDEFLEILDPYRHPCLE